ncbi:hypothetical protein MCOR23_009959 [Pyricularia oryzae]|nr:hypothetical protein MCOR01_009845 [Pyricularia oryzae]KAI6389701.1 hypothetical protein MCOR23_009959 [Pyricularia oryzae]
MACKGIRIGPRYGSKGSYLTQAWISRVVDVAERQVLRGFKGKKSYWYHRESPHVLCITGTIQQFETHKPPESPISGNFGEADLVRAAGPALAQPLEGGTTF